MFGMIFRTIKLVVFLSVVTVGSYGFALAYDKVPESLTPKALLGNNVELKNKLASTAQSTSLLSGIARKIYNQIYTPPLAEPAPGTGGLGEILLDPMGKAQEAVKGYEEAMKKQQEQLDNL